jgi:hypothetical protein
MAFRLPFQNTKSQKEMLLMKKSVSLIWLSSLTLLFVLVYAALGLFWLGEGASYDFTTLHGQTVQIQGRGVYQFDTVLSAAAFRGTDMITLFVVLPLLAISLLQYRRGSLRGGLLLTGSSFYCFYNALTLATGAAYNNLLLLYIAAMSLGFFAFVLAFMQVKLDELPKRVLPGMPHRGIAAFMLVAGVATAIIWLALILAPLLQGTVPEAVASYTTVITFVLDLGFITPIAILTGIMIRQRKPRGYVFASCLLLMLTLIGLVVIGQTIFQLQAGIIFGMQELIGLIASWIVLAAISGGLLIAFLRNIAEKAG